MKSIQEYLERAAAKDGPVRSGIILGVRMAITALNELEISEPRERRRSLVVIVETDRCLPDAVELVTGCRLGNRSLKFKDLGKMAASFVDLKTERATRVAAREIVTQRFSGIKSCEEREESLRRAYQESSEEDLFTVQRGRVRLAPEDTPGYRAARVSCATCGEGVSFGRQVIREDVMKCRSCATGSYFDS